LQITSLEGLFYALFELLGLRGWLYAVAEDWEVEMLLLEMEPGCKLAAWGQEILQSQGGQRVVCEAVVVQPLLSARLFLIIFEDL